MKKSTSKTASKMEKSSADSYSVAYNKLKASIDEAKRKESKGVVQLQKSMNHYIQVLLKSNNATSTLTI